MAALHKQVTQLNLINHISILSNLFIIILQLCKYSNVTR